MSNEQIERARRMAEEETASRLATLEAGHKSLHNDVAKLTDALGTFSREVRSGMEDLHKEISAQQKTPWGVLASWASVIIVIMGIIGSFYVRDLTNLEQRTNILNSTMFKEIEKSYERELRLMERLHNLELEASK